MFKVYTCTHRRCRVSNTSQENVSAAGAAGPYPDSLSSDDRFIYRPFPSLLTPSFSLNFQQEGNKKKDYKCKNYPLLSIHIANTTLQVARPIGLCVVPGEIKKAGQ